MRAIGILTLMFCSAVFFGQPAFAAKRVALVMGNSAYQNVSRLANPANDSAAMSAMLKGTGFDVVELKRDLKANEMRRALRDFSDQVRGADIAIVYFAGHGIEIDGINYVIPVDAVLERDIDTFDEAIPLDRLLAVIEPAKQLRLVILDACRDNPFDKTMKRTIAQRAVGRGLAKVEPTTPNTMIAFAAKAGSTASDGDKGSPFSTALVKYLPKPGLDLRKAFGFVRDDVLKATGSRQEPFIYGSLGGDDVALVPAVATPAAVNPPDPNAPIRRDYELAERVGTREGWDSFLSTYPDGFYAKLAQAQRNKLAAEEARVAATEKARLASEEQARLAAQGAKAAEQAVAAAQAKAAEEARLAAEKKKELEEARVAEAERAKAAALAKLEEDKRIAAEKKVADAGKAGDEKPVGPVAALTPPEQASEPVAGPGKPAEIDIPRLLQSELRRVGCNSGAIDGSWSAAAQKSLLLFNKNAGTKFDVKVASLEVLEAVRGKTARVCPLICEHGYRAEGDHCMRISCRPGYELGDDNSCERVRAGKPAAKREPPAEPRPQRAAADPPTPAGGQVLCNMQGCRPVRRGCSITMSKPGLPGGTSVQVEVCN